MKLPKLTRRQRLIVAVVVLALVAAVAVFVYRRRKAAQAAASAPVAGEAKVLPLVAAPALFSDCPNDSFPLKFGKCGKRVEQFQLYLIKQFGAQFSTYGVDGKWGEETEMLAKRYILKNDPFTISEDYFNKTGMYAYHTIKYA
jgi:hypothetical protein